MKHYEKQKELVIENFGLKKGIFSTGGWLIGRRPKCLLIRGDHLFFKLQKIGAEGVDYREGLINPDLTLYTITYIIIYIYK